MLRSVGSTEGDLVNQGERDANISIGIMAAVVVLAFILMLVS
jgi:hypothetical protein